MTIKKALEKVASALDILAGGIALDPKERAIINGCIEVVNAVASAQETKEPKSTSKAKEPANA